VVQFDVEPIPSAVRNLRDSVALLEAQEKLLTRVLDRVELFEPEQKRRRLLPSTNNKRASMLLARPKS
jgi:hypothetical protein